MNNKYLKKFVSDAVEKQDKDFAEKEKLNDNLISPIKGTEEFEPIENPDMENDQIYSNANDFNKNPSNPSKQNTVINSL